MERVRRLTLLIFCTSILTVKKKNKQLGDLKSWDLENTLDVRSGFIIPSSD